MTPLPPAAVGAIAGISVLLGMIGLVTYVTLLERKFAARMQSRIGPYRVGPHGLLQPLASGLRRRWALLGQRSKVKGQR